MTAPRKLSIDSVCACMWESTSERMREALCSLAGVPNINAILEWYELGEAEQKKLRAELADLIEASASRQRAEWCKQAELMNEAAA